MISILNNAKNLIFREWALAVLKGNVYQDGNRIIILIISIIIYNF